jgi:cupin fold WbuC family metalloprotein
MIICSLAYLYSDYWYYQLVGVIVAPPNNYRASSGDLVGIGDLSSPVKVLSSKYFDDLLVGAKTSVRKRKMVDLTHEPQKNSMQVLVNTWTDESYSPVHMHPDYSEAFIVVDGALALFTFSPSGDKAVCHIVEPKRAASDSGGADGQDVAIVVEAGQYHAMTAAPTMLGYPGHAVVFEISGHVYNPYKKSKFLAPWAPSVDDGFNGNPAYFVEKLLPNCRRRK